MTVPVEEIVQDVAVVATEVAHPVIGRAVLRAAARFCRRARIWRETVDADYAVPGFSAVGLSPPAGSRVVAPIMVSVEDAVLELVGDDLLETSPLGRPIQRVAFMGEELHFDGQFKGGERLLVRAVLEPTPSATSLPDVLGFEWREAIIAGTLSEVLRYYGGGRMDERRAMLHESRFNDLMVEARGRSRSGWTHAKRTVKYGGI